MINLTRAGKTKYGHGIIRHRETKSDTEYISPLFPQVLHQHWWFVVFSSVVSVKSNHMHLIFLWINAHTTVTSVIK